MTEPKTIHYYPRGRFLVDILLITDVFFLVLYAISTVFFMGFLIAALVLNFLEILIWFVWVRKVFTITVVSDTRVTGPAPNLAKKSIEFAQVDKWKTENLSSSTKKKGYVDIWAMDGTRIRIFRTILGRGQCYFILESVLRGYGAYGDPVRKIIVPYPNE
jgi:hypothetical protein